MKISDVKDDEIYGIGGIGNYYGGLSVRKLGDKFFWSIEDWDGHDWEEISKELFTILIEQEG